jgi:hypothetical protein
MGRLSSHVRTLLWGTALCWGVYALMFILVGSFGDGGYGDRVELAVMQLLLYGGLAALIVGLAGWLRDQPAQDESAAPTGAHRSRRPRANRSTEAGPS